MRGAAPIKWKIEKETLCLQEGKAMGKHAGKALLALIAVLLLAGACFAEELYPGENALAEAAKKEKGINSYDTGPTWANWQALFDGFEKRYGIQITRDFLCWSASVV